MLKANQRRAVHAMQAIVALAAALWLLGRLERKLAPIPYMLLLYALAEGVWALGAVGNQRDYEHHPRRPLINELRGLVGARGTVTRSCNPLGQVKVDGHLWQATVGSGAAAPQGAEVVVRRADSLILEVEPWNMQEQGVKGRVLLGS